MILHPGKTALYSWFQSDLCYYFTYMKKFIQLSFFVSLFLASCNRVSHEPVDPNGITYKIPFLSSVTIDGSNDDWNNAGFSARLFANHLGEFVPESDLSASFRLAWDKEGGGRYDLRSG